MERRDVFCEFKERIYIYCTVKGEIVNYNQGTKGKKKLHSELVGGVVRGERIKLCNFRVRVVTLKKKDKRIKKECGEKRQKIK